MKAPKVYQVHNIAERRRWHISKSVSLDAIVAIIVFCVSIITWATWQKFLIEASAKAIENNTAEIKQMRKEIRKDLKDLGARIDRLIENGKK